MANFRCKACLGLYTSPQRGGVSYFHLCAPMHNPTYDAQFALDVNGDRVPKGPLNPAIPEMMERPDRRDENVMRQPDGQVVPKTPGTGRDTL